MIRRASLIILLITLFSSLKAQQMPECWYRCQAAFEKGEYTLASKWIDSCIIQKDKSFIYWLRDGEIKYNKDDYANTLESLLKADKLKKGSSAFMLAKTYCSLNDTASCFLWLKTYLSQSDKVSEGQIKLDPAFDKVSSTPQWKKIWKNEWYNPTEKLIFDVEYSLSNESWEEALDLLNPRLNGSKPKPQLLVLRANAYYGLKSYKNAIDDYSIAIKRSKKNHQYLALRANAYIASEKYSLAVTDLTNAIALSGGNPKYYLSRAEANFKSKSFSNAFDDITYYLSFYQSDSKASLLLVQIAIENGNYVDALFRLNKLIKTSPNKIERYYYRGIIYIKTMNYQVAETDLNLVISKGYNLADSYYQRGIARINLNQKDNACKDWEKASELGNFKAQELLYSKCNKAATLKKW